MDKALEMGQASATGSFKLFVGKILSTVILALGTIILTILISEGDYGLYAIALIPAQTMLLFQDWGVGSAMIKYCAHYRAINKEGELRKIIVSGLTFQVATGLALAVLLFLIGNFISSTIFGKPQSAFLVTVASLSILSTAIFAGCQSIFVGFERMGLSSLGMICQATAQCATAPLLVYLGYGATGAILGYITASAVGAISSAALLYFAIFKRLRFDNQEKNSKLQTLKPLLHYGVPLGIGAIFFGIGSQFYSFMAASLITDVALIGNLTVATNFAVLLTFFSVPITTVLFPAFSKLNPQDERQLVKTVFTSSVKYSSFFLVPATLALMVLSGPIIGTIYGGKWIHAPFFLTLFVTSYLYVIIGALSYGTFLQAVGETKMLMKLNILALCIGVPLSFFLISTFGIPGVIFTGIIAATPSMIIGLYWTWKHYEVKANFLNSGKIFLSSAIAALTTYLFLSVFNSADWIRFVAGTLLFLGMYLVVTPLVGAITQSDVDSLRVMFSRFGVFSKIMEIPLLLLERVLKMRERGKPSTNPTRTPQT